MAYQDKLKPISPASSGTPSYAAKLKPIAAAAPAAAPKRDLLDRAATGISKIFPGAQLGKAIGTSAYGFYAAGKKALKGDFQGARQELKTVGDENNANFKRIVGDTVQAVALPASLAATAPTAIGRLAVNTGLAALIGGGNSAARGKDAKTIARDAAIGGAAGAAFSGVGEGVRLFKAGNPAKSALKAVTPDFNAATKTQRGKLISETVGGAPRVNEGGIFKSRTLTPNKAEVDAAAELTKLPGYQPKATALKNFNTVRSAITSKAQAFEKSLVSEKTIVPKKEIVSTVRGAVTSKADESLLLQGSDPSVTQYLRVVENAAGKANGTPKGIWDVRKAMDAAYENARGRLAYDSDKVAALDEVHRAGRDALNDLMTKYAKNTNVKAEFQTLRNLFHAKDELLIKAQGEKGSVFKRAAATIQRNPVTAAIGASAATALGANQLLK